MTAIELFKKNKQYLKKSGFMCGDMSRIHHVDIKEDEAGYEVVLNHENSVYVNKKEDFPFDDFYQGERLEIRDLRSINVLNVLNVITRETRYCGFDNYIYLIYDNIDIFAALACVVDMSVMLDKNKFKVCIENSIQKENAFSGAKRFFQKTSGRLGDRDDKGNTCMEQYNELQFEELNHLIFFFQPQNSGLDFFRHVIKQSSYVIHSDGWGIHRKAEYIEDYLLNHGYFKRMFLDNTRLYSGADVVHKLKNMPRILCQLDGDEIAILHQLERIIGKRDNLSFSDLCKAYFLAKYYSEHDVINHRIVPIIIYFPDHYVRYMEYYTEIRKNFLHISFFRTVRNPVIRSIRAYFASREGTPQRLAFLFTRYLDVLFEDFSFDDFSCSSGCRSAAVRFEDLKHYPREYMMKVCDYLGIPFEEKLIQSKEVFRLDSVSPPIDKEIFTDKDVKTLQALYREIMKHYEYENLIEDTADPDFTSLDLDFMRTDYANLMDIDYDFIREELTNRLLQVKKKKFTPDHYPLWIK